MRHTLLERAHQLRHYREHFTVLFSQKVPPAGQGVPGPAAPALSWADRPITSVGAQPARGFSGTLPGARRHATARLKFPLQAAAPAWNPAAGLEDRGARWTPESDAIQETPRTEWPAALSVLDANELLDATIAALQEQEEQEERSTPGTDGLDDGTRWLSPPLPPAEARPTVPDSAPLWIAEPDEPDPLPGTPGRGTTGAPVTTDTSQFNARTGQMTFRDLLAFNSGTSPTPEPPAAAAPAPVMAAPDRQAPSATAPVPLPAVPETPVTPAGDTPMNLRAPSHPQQTMTPVAAQEPAGPPNLPGQPPAPVEPRRPDEPLAPPVPERPTVPEQADQFTSEHHTAPEQLTAGENRGTAPTAASREPDATSAVESVTPAQPAPPVTADPAFPSGPPLLDLSDPAFVPPADDPTTRERLQALLPPTSADARFSLPRRPRPVPLTPPKVQDTAPVAPLHSPEQVQSILARLNRQQESEAEGTPEMRALSIDEMLSWKRSTTPEPTDHNGGGAERGGVPDPAVTPPALTSAGPQVAAPTSGATPDQVTGQDESVHRATVTNLTPATPLTRATASVPGSDTPPMPAVVRSVQGLTPAPGDLAAPVPTRTPADRPDGPAAPARDAPPFPGLKTGQTGAGTVRPAQADGTVPDEPGRVTAPADNPTVPGDAVRQAQSNQAQRAETGPAAALADATGRGAPHGPAESPAPVPEATSPSAAAPTTTSSAGEGTTTPPASVEPTGRTTEPTGAAGEPPRPAQPAPPVTADPAFPSGPPLLDLSDPAFVPPADDPATRERLQALLPPTSADARFSLPRRPRPVPLTPPKVQDTAPVAPLHSPEQVQSILARLNRQQESEAEGTPEMRALSIDEMLSWKRSTTPEPTDHEGGGEPGKAAELGDPAEAHEPDPGTPPAAQLDAALPPTEVTDARADHQEASSSGRASDPPPTEALATDDQPDREVRETPPAFTTNAERALAKALIITEQVPPTTDPVLAAPSGRTPGAAMDGSEAEPPAVPLPTPSEGRTVQATTRAPVGTPARLLDVPAPVVQEPAGAPQPRPVPGLSAPADVTSGEPATRLKARSEGSITAQDRGAAEASTPAFPRRAPPEAGTVVASGLPVEPDVLGRPEAKAVPIPSAVEPVGIGASVPVTLLEPAPPPTAPREPSTPVTEMTVPPVTAEEAPAAAGAPRLEAESTAPPASVQHLNDDLTATRTYSAALLTVAVTSTNSGLQTPQGLQPGLAQALHEIFATSSDAPGLNVPDEPARRPAPSPEPVEADNVARELEIAEPRTVLPERRPDIPEPVDAGPGVAAPQSDVPAAAFTPQPAVPRAVSGLRIDPSRDTGSEPVTAAPVSLQETAGHTTPVFLPERNRGGRRRVTAHLTGEPAAVTGEAGAWTTIPLTRPLDVQGPTASEPGRGPGEWARATSEVAARLSTDTGKTVQAKSPGGSASEGALAGAREVVPGASEPWPGDPAGAPPVAQPHGAGPTDELAGGWAEGVPQPHPAPGAAPRSLTVTSPGVGARPLTLPRPGGPERSAQPRPVVTGGVSALVQRALTNPSAREPLPLGVRERLAPMLGADVPGVTLVRDAHAAAATAEAAADALAVGDAVLLSPGQDLASPRGLALLAHELTHVLRDRDPSFVPAVLRAAPRQPATAVPARRRAPAPAPAPARMDEETLAEHVEGRVQQVLADPTQEPSAGPAFRAASWPGLPAPWEPMPFWDAPPGTERPAGPVRPVAVAAPSAPPVGSPPPVSAPAAPVARAASTSRSVPAADGGSADGAGRAQGPAVAADRRQSQRAPDLDQLAQQVYRVLKRRLAAEVRRGR